MPDEAQAYFDRQEVRDPADREASLFQALPGLLRHAIDNSPYFAARFSDIKASDICSRGALAGLPVLRKSDLVAQQRQTLPFAGMAATPTNRLAHIYASPGPIYDPEGVRADYWRFARAMYAAGLRRGDLIHNTFSYHLTPAGNMIGSGARKLGCPVIPAGTGQTEIQIGIINDLQPVAYTGTPSFLSILLDRAEELGHPLTSFKKALLAGEAVPKDLQSRLAALGVTARQCYGTADVGLIAYETSAMEGLVVDESVILEVVRPGTGDVVAVGEIGEVVVTVFNPDYPLIRLATGDLSKVIDGPSECGRTNMRLAGWLGRADQTLKVRGMFVRPEQIATIVARVPDLQKARLVVSAEAGRDVMELRCEVAGNAEDLEQQIGTIVREVTGLRAEVLLCGLGTIANDGKVIEDQRPVG